MVGEEVEDDIGGQGTGVDLWCWFFRRVPAAGGGCPSIVTSRPPAHATVVGPGAGDQGGVDGGRDGRDDEDEATKHVLRDSMCQRAMADGQVTEDRTTLLYLPPNSRPSRQSINPLGDRDIQMEWCVGKLRQSTLQA